VVRADDSGDIDGEVTIEIVSRRFFEGNAEDQLADSIIR
jgi:hypothetical protein